MRSKTILSIAAFIVAFAVSTALASLFITKNTTEYRHTNCFSYKTSATAGKISALIKRDVANGRARDRKLFRANEAVPPAFGDASFGFYAETIEKYVDASNRLDADDLPEDFAVAWQLHMQAWREYSNFLDDVKTSSTPLNREKLAAIDARHSADINRTWYDVLRIGHGYGADIY